MFRRSVAPSSAKAVIAAITAAALVAAIVLAGVPSPASACTTFRLRAKDGSWIVGRSMELAMPLDSAVMVVPRNYPLSSTRPDLKPGTSWKSRHGFVGLNTLGIDITTDGMNEAGLSVGVLYIPGFVQYQPFPATGDAISNLELANWMLSRFATVDEVRAALQAVAVYDLVLPQAGGPQPLHWAVADAKGGAIVVEYVGGKLQVHDNPIGVLTNSPNFEWHQVNLRNHVNLTDINVEPLKLGSVEIAPLGQGSGLLGIPGDWTPPSRFVRATAVAWSVQPTATALEMVNAAFHVLNTVDIPVGAVAQKYVGKDGKPGIIYEQTQWATVHDITSKVAYFRTYGNLDVHKVELAGLDFTGSRIGHVPLPGKMAPRDLTGLVK